MSNETSEKSEKKAVTLVVTSETTGGHQVVIDRIQTTEQVVRDAVNHMKGRQEGTIEHELFYGKDINGLPFFLLLSNNFTLSIKAEPAE